MARDDDVLAVGSGAGPHDSVRDADRRGLLAWAADQHRQLPWRRTRDPWRVLVAEVMLQQTQVGRVAERWPTFLERFPTPRECAAATVGDVVDRWVGLGYNRRAVALHGAAVRCVETHDGRVPDSLDALLALPGVGPYTARAVLAFAFERDVGVVDTNVGRVLARVAGRRLAPAEAQATADALVPVGHGWAWNQAMLDLGALACRSRNPACPSCPLRSACRWRDAGHPDPDPAVGSAGVAGGQSRFEGSDRQGRGALVRELQARGRLRADELAGAAGWPGQPERAAAVAEGLVRDGLADSDGSGGLRRRGVGEETSVSS